MTNRQTIFSLNWLQNSSCLTVLGVLVSGAALALSPAGLSGGLPFNAAWLAIACCGAPIIAGAARALVCEHDVKADLFVTSRLRLLRPRLRRRNLRRRSRSRRMKRAGSFRGLRRR